MSNFRRRVSLNFSSVFLGRGFALVINLFAVVIAGRALGVKNFGVFAATLSVINILTNLIDLGFSPIVTREMSKKHSDFSFINNAVSIRLIFFIILVIVANFFFAFLDVANKEILYLNILMINILISARFLSFRDLLETPFKVVLKMHIVMALYFADNFMLLILVLFIPYFNDKLLYYVIVFTAANLPGFLFLIYLLKKTFGYKFRFATDKAKWLLRESVPLMGYVIFLSLFAQLDVVLTKHFISDSASGIYAAALRIIQPFRIFPVAVISTVIPIIVSSLEKEYGTRVKMIIKLVYKLLIIGSLLIAVIFAFKSNEVVLLSFGEKYAKSADVVKILAWTNLFLFFNFFSVELLTVFNKQKYNFFQAFLLAVTDIIAFFLFYEKLGVAWVAFARLLAIVTGFLFLIFALKNVKVDMKIFTFRFLFFTAFFTGTAFLLSSLNVFAYVSLVSVLFVMSVLFIGIFNSEETDILLEIGKVKKLSPRLYALLKRISR